MTAQQCLADIANLGTTNIRVQCHVSALNAWSTKEMRDTFRHFSAHLSITKVGVGPIVSESFTGKNLDAVCDKALSKAKTTLSEQSPIVRKKLKIKRP